MKNGQEDPEQVDDAYYPGSDLKRKKVIVEVLQKCDHNIYLRRTM